MKKAIFIMGVSGCGKSSIGKLLSETLKIPFYDGDDFHSESNITKMSKGEPLNDADRESWLAVLNNIALTQLNTNSCVIACSALKQKYRDILSQNIEEQTRWVHLSGSFDLIFRRINNRKSHFMPSNLLKSQFDILEEPENALQLDINLSPDEMINIIKGEILKNSEATKPSGDKNN